MTEQRQCGYVCCPEHGVLCVNPARLGSSFCTPHEHADLTLHGVGAIRAAEILVRRGKAQELGEVTA